MAAAHGGRARRRLRAVAHRGHRREGACPQGHPRGDRAAAGLGGAHRGVNAPAACGVPVRWTSPRDRPRIRRVGDGRGADDSGTHERKIRLSPEVTAGTGSWAPGVAGPAQGLSPAATTMLEGARPHGMINKRSRSFVIGEVETIRRELADAGLVSPHRIHPHSAMALAAFGMYFLISASGRSSRRATAARSRGWWSFFS